MNPIEHPLITLSELNSMLFPLKLDKVRIAEDLEIPTVKGDEGVYSLAEAIVIVNAISDICFKALEVLSARLPDSINITDQQTISRTFLNYLLFPCNLKAADIEEFRICSLDGSIGRYTLADAIEIVNNLSDICYNALEILSKRLLSTTGSPYELD